MMPGQLCGSLRRNTGYLTEQCRERCTERGGDTTRERATKEVGVSMVQPAPAPLESAVQRRRTRSVVGC